MISIAVGWNIGKNPRPLAALYFASFRTVTGDDGYERFNEDQQVDTV